MTVPIIQQPHCPCFPEYYIVTGGVVGLVIGFLIGWILMRGLVMFL